MSAFICAICENLIDSDLDECLEHLDNDLICEECCDKTEEINDKLENEDDTM